MLTKILKQTFGHGKKAWFLNHINDIYVKKANQLNYRSRASFKLLELIKKYPMLIQSQIIDKSKPNNKIYENNQSQNTNNQSRLVRKVLDLGCAPGSWSQVLKQLLPDSQVVAVDLLDMKQIKGVDFYKCDARNKQLQFMFQQKYGKFQLIVSDMAPNFDGDGANTHLQILQLNCLCVQLCLQLGMPSCSLVMKSLQGQSEKNFFNLLNLLYTNVFRQKPSSSRSQSMEFFYVCQKLRIFNSKENQNLSKYMKNVGLNIILELQKHHNKKEGIKYFENILKN